MFEGTRENYNRRNNRRKNLHILRKYPPPIIHAKNIAAMLSPNPPTHTCQKASLKKPSVLVPTNISSARTRKFGFMTVAMAAAATLLGWCVVYGTRRDIREMCEKRNQGI